MNAPAPAALADLVVEVLPLDAILPSETYVQSLRRKRFNPEALLELAATVARLKPVSAAPDKPEATKKAKAKKKGRG